MRLLLLVLTRQQIHGMKTMQMLQPVMKEIQRFYPDRNDQSAKTMELYTQYKINPLSGCLPMFIQLPIMFGVYRALYDASFAGKDFLGHPAPVPRQRHCRAQLWRRPRPGGSDRLDCEQAEPARADHPHPG